MTSTLKIESYVAFQLDDLITCCLYLLRNQEGKDGCIDLKEILQTVCSLQEGPKMLFMINPFGPSNSGDFSWAPEKKNLNIDSFGGDLHQVCVKFTNAIHKKNCAKSNLGLPASTGAIHLGFGWSNVPVSVANLCVVYPAHRSK